MVSLLLAALLWSDPVPSSQPVTLLAPWGRFEETHKADGLWKVVPLPAVEGWLSLPSELPQVVRAYQAGDPRRTALPLEWSADESRFRLQIPAVGDDGAKDPRTTVLETAAQSGQRPDGRIILRSGDGELPRTKLKAETNAGLAWIDLRSDAGHSLVWKYKATRPGTYDVELTAAATEQGTAVEFSLGDRTLSHDLPTTETDSRFSSTTLGRLTIARPGEYEARLRVGRRDGRAVVKVAAIVLRPAGEGQPIVQAADGVVTCAARDVTIHGVQVQYEPRPEKNTVGYWTNPTDRVAWEFTLTMPGKFKVEILQGCGKGQGGSEVELAVGGETLPFVVEDTGHFQNFVPRTIGTVRLERPGPYVVEVRPVRKAGVAVMDLRQVRLVPIE